MKEIADETRPARATVEAGDNERSVEAAVTLEAPIETVWRALTEAAELTRWFPLDARVEPGAEGSIWMSWRNEYEGTSEILVWKPPNHLRTTWGELDGQGPAQVTDYMLEGRAGTTVLRVVTSGFPDDPSWDDWVEGTRSGWDYELSSLRRYLERHPGQDRVVVYLRRRVELDRERVSERLFGPEGLEVPPLGGDVLHHDPPRQVVAETEEPPGLMRASIDPAPGRDALDVTLFLSAWGVDETRIAPVRDEWSALLERLFPEGETV